VVGSARDGLEALELALALKPDVILMDIGMPRCDGIAATKLVHTELPQIHIVMLTTSAADDDLFEAMKSGASGYLLKSLDADTFFALLSSVMAGEPALSPEMASRILREFARAPRRQRPAPLRPTLTERQIEVLQKVVDGLTYKDIAAGCSSPSAR
jgi:DNA-binding NarL/FixJ family response regulator